MITDKEKFSDVWNADRIIKTYIIIASNKGGKEDLEIRRAQLEAALNAYSELAKRCDDNGLRSGFGIFLDMEMSDGQRKEFDQLSQQIFKDGNICLRNLFTIPSQYLDSVRTRSTIFGIMLEYRLAVQKLLDHYAGVLECSPAYALAIHTTKQLYETGISESNITLDRMLCLLMGKVYEETIPEWKLIEEYSYPAYTEEELMDMYYDNL